VRLEVFDAAGRLRRTLFDGAAGAGSMAVRWDGRDGARRELAAGVYFLRLTAGGAERTVRAIIQR
jgi:hypothetical protein